MPRIQNSKISNRYSKTLVNTFIAEKCKGTFCNFVLRHTYQDKFLLLNSNLNKKEIPLENHLAEDVEGPKLHFNIFFNLVIKAKRNAKIVVKLLKENKYVPNKVIIFFKRNI